MSGLKRGDRVKVIGSSELSSTHCIIGCIGTVKGFDNGHYAVQTDEETDGHDCHGMTDDGHGWWVGFDDLQLLEEEDTMAKKQSNPKNFRNGDVIKVSNKDDYAALVYVKFGENYYNLTAGGQMKACRYLPPGQKEIITNLSGMGKFFLMSEEELEDQASKQDSDDDDDDTWAIPISPSTVADFEQLFKTAEKYIQTDTTEEK